MLQKILRWFRRGSVPPAMKAQATEALKQHTQEFRQEVLQVTEGVYVAIGFGLANCILLEGDDGVVIVDTLGSVEAAQQAQAALQQHTTKPVKAIVYTHNHTDHIFGAGVFAGDANPEVYAHATTSAYIDKIASMVRPIITRRSMRQFGVFLREDQINAGIGRALETNPDCHLALKRPTHTFTDRLQVTLAGISIEMLHAPGETDDQIVLWLPEKKVLIAADNFYHSFPNLYAIRGTAYRDVRQWVRSLDLMRRYRPEILVPCHTRPLFGADHIYQVLTNYRDAIQFVHDQTVRWMNKGLTPDEIVERVQLPSHLAASPYLQEFYGTVAWSVRSVFAGYLGWFHGNPTELHPLAPQKQAQHMADLAGGFEGLRQHLQKAIQEQNFQWALELSDHLLRLQPHDQECRDARVQALIGMAETQTSANGRNYYLTSAMELQGFQIPLTRNIPLDVVHSLPLPILFAAIAANLHPEKSADIDQCIGFHFPDTQEDFTLHIRRSVAEVQPHFPEKPDITLTIDATIWKEIVAGLRNPVTTFAGGKIQIEGGATKLAQLLLLSEKPA